MMRPKSLAIATAVLVILHALPALGAPLSYPVRVEDGFPTPGPPPVTAAAWILYDESSDTVLASFQPTEQRAMASTTKIMTALVALERANLDDVVTVSTRAANTGEREIELYAGEQLTLEALLKAALIHSANDAATAIAEHVGGSVEGFVALMNLRAEELGLDQTRFANPHGLDAPDHHSSARDLLELARIAMEHPQFADAVRSRVVVFPDAPDGTERAGTATNLMLGEYDGASGIKTGFTSQALLTFVATAERDGRRLYVVVLGSDGPRAHFGDVEALFDYGFQRLGIYGTVATGSPYVSVKERLEPGPLLVTSNIESFVHLAGQGLMTSPPAPVATPPEPEPPAVTVIKRYPAPHPDTPEAALAYWWDRFFGG